MRYIWGMKRPSVGDHIVRTASRLFYKQGYSNTGVNQIIAEAGIAKSTLLQALSVEGGPIARVSGGNGKSDDGRVAECRGPGG
jgi:hypothetical protein